MRNNYYILITHTVCDDLSVVSRGDSRASNKRPAASIQHNLPENVRKLKGKYRNFTVKLNQRDSWSKSKHADTKKDEEREVCGTFSLFSLFLWSWVCHLCKWTGPPRDHPNKHWTLSPWRYHHVGTGGFLFFKEIWSLALTGRSHTHRHLPKNLTQMQTWITAKFSWSGIVSFDDPLTVIEGVNRMRKWGQTDQLPRITGKDSPAAFGLVGQNLSGGNKQHPPGGKATKLRYADDTVAFVVAWQVISQIKNNPWRFPYVL